MTSRVERLNFSNNSLAQDDGNVAEDPDIPSDYHTETADFPESPQCLKSFQRVPDDDTVTDLSTSDDIFHTATLDDNSVSLKESNTASSGRRKKLSVWTDIITDASRDDQHSLSSVSIPSDAEDTDVPAFDDITTPEDIDTPDELIDPSPFYKPRPPPEPIAELTAEEEREEERRWRTCIVGGVQQAIDMHVIEPYKKVISHGGYFGESRQAIIVFSTCFLPDHSRRDYSYVMDNLFLYTLTTLDQLIAEDYVLVYLHASTERGNMPSFSWMKRCYHMIDRKLRKNLKGLYLVHPTFWLKTIVVMTKPFISTKFSRKLRFVSSLAELAQLVPIEQLTIPEQVRQYDEEHKTASISPGTTNQINGELTNMKLTANGRASPRV